MKFGQCKKENVLFYLFHLLLIAFAVLSCVVYPHKVNTDFSSVVPSNMDNEELSRAESVFLSGQNLNVNMIVEASSFTEAKNAAELLAKDADALGVFKNSVLDDNSDYFLNREELNSYIAEHVYFFLDKETQNKINRNTENFVEDRLASVFSSFSLSSLASLDKDPFMLSDLVFRNLLKKISGLSSLTEKDGFLFTKIDGKFYILLSGTLKEDVSVASSKNELSKLFKIVSDINSHIDFLSDNSFSDKSEKNNGNVYNAENKQKPAEKPALRYADSFENNIIDKSSVKVYLSGTPLHTYKSAMQAKREISLISMVSVCVILLLFFIVFRNVYILKPFLISLGLSLISAISALFLFFRDIHIITLIFGTSLIGTGIDYSVHFYVHYAKIIGGKTDGGVCKIGKENKLRIFRSLTIGFISTFFCYSLLLFSVYPVLKEISVFCMAGLVSSYITVVCMFKNMITKRMVNSNSPAVKLRLKRNHGNYLPFLFLFFCVLTLILYPRYKVENRIQDLYAPPEDLLRGEEIFSKVMGYEDVSYALISADSLENALETEYSFVSSVSGSADFLGVSCFFPPLSEQKESMQSSKRLLPYLDYVSEVLGLESDVTGRVKENIENAKPDLRIPSVLDFLNIGKVGEHYYLSVIIRDAKNKDYIKNVAQNLSLNEKSSLKETDNQFEKSENSYQNLEKAETNSLKTQKLQEFGALGNVYFIETAKEISKNLDLLTIKILKLFSLGLGVIVLVLIISFGFKNGLLIALAPLSVVSGTMSFCTLLGMKIDFFFVVALVLVLGLGLDYIVFMAGSVLKRNSCKKKKRNREDLKNQINACDLNNEELYSEQDKSENAEENSPYVSVFLSFATTELSFGVLSLSTFMPVRIFGTVVFSGIFFAYACALLWGEKVKKTA